jgi:hypothetical protein
MPRHQVDPPLVVFGVEAKTAVGARGAKQPVTPLPGTQALGRDSGAPAQLADSEMSRRSVHAPIVRNLYRRLTESIKLCNVFLKEPYREEGIT